MGNSALHVVSQGKQDDHDFDGSVARIELLLKYRIDPMARNHEGKTPAEWYRQLGRDELADYLAGRCGRRLSALRLIRGRPGEPLQSPSDGQ